MLLISRDLSLVDIFVVKLNNRTEATQELAREFASIGLAYDEAGRVRGESRYSGTAGNAASISPAEIEAALDRGRAGQTQDYDPNKTYKTGDVVKKNGMLMKFDGFGWAALNDGLQSSNPDVGTIYNWHPLKHL